MGFKEFLMRLFKVPDYTGAVLNLQNELKTLTKEVNSLTSENNALKARVNSLNNQVDVLKEELAFSSQPIQGATSLGKITHMQASELLKSHTGELWLSDNYFDVTSQDEAKAFVEKTRVNYKQYIAEGHDCDNFSMELAGYWSSGLESFAFGIAWSKIHAFNIMIDNDKTLWICEPQTNKWFKLDDDVKSNQLYYPMSIIMM